MAVHKFNYAKHYVRVHKHNPKWFSGRIGLDNAAHVAELLDAFDDDHRPRLLDYGSGKGYQYLWARVHELWWNGNLPYLYDPGVVQLSAMPEGPFDGIICTDVMEHIHPGDVDLILQDIFARVRRGGFVYFNIFCNPSRKEIYEGVGVHLTVRPPDWWRAKLDGYRTGEFIIRDDYEYKRSNDLQRAGLD